MPVATWAGVVDLALSRGSGPARWSPCSWGSSGAETGVGCKHRVPVLSFSLLDLCQNRASVQPRLSFRRMSQAAHFVEGSECCDRRVFDGLGVSRSIGLPRLQCAERSGGEQDTRLPSARQPGDESLFPLPAGRNSDSCGRA